ncbi:hypothetical protein BDY19DRAFT_1059227, partial [Irpex rosettiformis]
MSVDRPADHVADMNKTALSDRYLWYNTNILIWEGDPIHFSNLQNTLIENFCLDLRRLELFGRARSLQRGWVSALAEGEELSIGAAQGSDVAMEGDETPVRWEQEMWEAKMREFVVHTGGKCVVPMTSEINALRPKSLIRGGSTNRSHRGPNPCMSNQLSGVAVPTAVVMGPLRHTNNFHPLRRDTLNLLRMTYLVLTG